MPIVYLLADPAQGGLLAPWQRIPRDPISLLAHIRVYRQQPNTLSYDSKRPFIVTHAPDGPHNRKFNIRLLGRVFNQDLRRLGNWNK